MTITRVIRYQCLNLLYFLHLISLLSKKPFKNDARLRSSDPVPIGAHCSVVSKLFLVEDVLYMMRVRVKMACFASGEEHEVEAHELTTITAHSKLRRPIAGNFSETASS